MKFSVKVFLITVVAIAVAMAAGGFYIVDSVFDSSLDSAVDNALDRNRMICFGLTTAVANIPMNYDELPDEVVREIAAAMESGNMTGVLYFSLSSERSGEEIYSRGVNPFEYYTPMNTPSSDELSYRIGSTDDSYYIETISLLPVPGRTLVLTVISDITSVFTQRSDSFAIYRTAVIAAIVLTAVFMLFISHYLTKPIREITKAARGIEGGDLETRARVKSDDEMEQLADSFNKMAESLEEHISQLENDARSREDFIGSFAHELKTPLTAIIGYSDMLRSRDMSEKDRFTAANYIFSESRRLESLSLKLMDIIVLGRSEAELKQVNGRLFLSEILGVVLPSFKQHNVKLKVRGESEAALLEPDLMKTLVINLLDNARKASEPGGRVELYGQVEDGHYAIIVRDYGRGIPAAELSKITEAFYMVDKSRAREQNGAGLGLAISAMIARLHGSELEFKSKEGEGTAVRVLLQLASLRDEAPQGALKEPPKKRNPKIQIELIEGGELK